MGDPLTKYVGLTQEIFLHRIANRIRQSLELQEILSATVAEVRSFIGTDRVKIYQSVVDQVAIAISQSMRKFVNYSKAIASQFIALMLIGEVNLSAIMNS